MPVGCLEGRLVGWPEGKPVGLGTCPGKPEEMTSLRIDASAAKLNGSEAKIFTPVQFFCEGVGNEMAISLIITACEVSSVKTWLMLSTEMTIFVHAPSGRSSGVTIDPPAGVLKMGCSVGWYVVGCGVGGGEGYAVVGCGVGSGVGSSEGTAVGCVGMLEGCAVGCRVGWPVGFRGKVGTGVGFGLGIGVGSGVGFKLGIGVGRVGRRVIARVVGLLVEGLELGMAVGMPLG